MNRDQAGGVSEGKRADFIKINRRIVAVVAIIFYFCKPFQD